jgi:class 3 adenylate cyclase
VASGVRYARSGDAHIAYQTLGDGPIDLVFSFGFISHVEHVLAEPHFATLFEHLATFSRLVLYDNRGVGLSDAAPRPLLLEDQVDDVIAVLDDLGSESAAVVGQVSGGAFAMLLAATYPERVSHLILISAFARMTYADDYPWANPPEVRDVIVKLIIDKWGTGEQATTTMPSLANDRDFREWFGALERLSNGPGAALRAFEVTGSVDVRPVLPSIYQPTLVMHPAATTFIDHRHSKYLAEHIPNARYVEYPSADVLPVQPEAIEFTGAEIEEFLTGSRTPPAKDRALHTMLFTDMVDSTQRAAELGDADWRQLLDRHDNLVRKQLAHFKGHEVKTTGDGFFATFDGPERAVRCALAINKSVGEAGIPVRAGIHTGECEVRGNDLGGINVHIGARVAAKAGSQEVLVSRTVRDLVVGSELSFDDRGEYELKGVPGTWQLFAAAT